MNIILQFRIKETYGNCQSLRKYEKFSWVYVFQYCMFFIQMIQGIDKLKDPPKNSYKLVRPKKKWKVCETQKIAQKDDWKKNLTIFQNQKK